MKAKDHLHALYNTSLPPLMPVTKPKSPPVVLVIAGYDPSSGAGITADIKTIAAHGCYAISCITALTVQSTRGVRRVQPLAARTISETLEELAADFKIAAIKIGMLGSLEAAREVSAFLERKRKIPVVLDPVIRSSSGAELITQRGLAFMRRSMIALATAITPNLDEAAALSGLRVRTREDMLSAAQALRALGARAVIITGGHLKLPMDLLSLERRTLWLRGKHITTRSTHGTGCAFSTALACNLALGRSIEAAARAAKRFVEHALKTAPKVGKGTGPII
jgi:hydroxymethylpyrimidine/phosphomethylpyrimidine kinase